MATHDHRLELRSHSTSEAAITRRDFVMATLAAGFVLAVRPVSAETLTTDQTGLTAGEIQIQTTDGDIPAYRAKPEQGASLPVVLVVQEIFGVHEHIRDICRRFAKLGYLAIAPELYARQGDVSKLSDRQEIISKVVSQVPDAQVLTDLDATVAWAKASGEGNVEKLGITGFCWGGRIVWLYAAHNSNLNAGVAWYGKLAGKTSALQPKYPLDEASNLKAPVLGLYGAEDRGIPLGGRPSKRPGVLLRLWSIPIPPTASMRTIGQATERNRRRMSGSDYRTGSSNMGWGNASTEALEAYVSHNCLEEFSTRDSFSLIGSRDGTIDRA